MASKTKELFTEAAVAVFRAALENWRQIGRDGRRRWTPDEDDFADLAKQTGETLPRVMGWFSNEGFRPHSVDNPLYRANSRGTTLPLQRSSKMDSKRRKLESSRETHRERKEHRQDGNRKHSGKVSTDEAISNIENDICSLELRKEEAQAEAAANLRCFEKFDSVGDDRRASRAEENLDRSVNKLNRIGRGLESKMADLEVMKDILGETT